MNREEFKNYIESLGFKVGHSDIYTYIKYNTKMYKICLYYNGYGLYNGSRWDYCGFNDLTPLNRIDRSYKLKQLLG